MCNVRRRMIVFAIVPLVIMGASFARADLVTTVTPTITGGPGNIWFYSYNVANSSTSTVGVGEFDLSLLSGSLLDTFSVPTGFLTLYTAGDPDIQFLSTDPSFDIAPGSSATFSFRANATPGLAPDALRGFDANGGVFTQTGLILTPSVVPEPSVIVLSGLGLACIVAPRFLRGLSKTCS